MRDSAFDPNPQILLIQNLNDTASTTYSKIQHWTDSLSLKTKDRSWFVRSLLERSGWSRLKRIRIHARVAVCIFLIISNGFCLCDTIWSYKIRFAFVAAKIDCFISVLPVLHGVRCVYLWNTLGLAKWTDYWGCYWLAACVQATLNHPRNYCYRYVTEHRENNTNAIVSIDVRSGSMILI